MGNLAVIPARGASKRIPRKNIKLFSGKPMIAYAIAAAHDSGLFDRIVVSTEDESIARTAREFGAETPFVRPAELADDHTPTVPVIAHAIRTCCTGSELPERVCCIYPCVPFLQIEDLQGALNQLKSTGAAYCFPVAEFPSTIQRALRRLHNGMMQPYFPENELIRTQDLEPAYFDAGQFYWGKTESWLEMETVHVHGSGYVIPQWRIVDIDTPEDWRRAELLSKVMASREQNPAASSTGLK